MLMNWLRRLKYAQVIDKRQMHAIWEPAHLGRLLPLLQVDCVFDVGANEGQYAQMLRHAVGYKGRIVSFEPIPEAAAKLRTIAAGDPLWSIEEVALAEANGLSTFNVMSDSQFSSLSQPRHDDVRGFETMNQVSREVQVKTESLVSALSRLQARWGFERPFLKLDTQGMDVAILQAAGRQSLACFVGLQSELAIRKLYREAVDYRDA